MNSKTVLSVILAMTLASGGVAFAQPNGRHDRWRDEQVQRSDQRSRHDNNGRWSDRRAPRIERWEERGAPRIERWEGRGAGPNHDFRRGQRLPMEFRHRQYVVDDWRGHHLSAPPRGYHWVQTGGDYVLVAIATGVILQLLLNN